MKFSLEKLKSGLFKTRKSLLQKVSFLVGLHKSINEKLLTELEEILIKADVGVQGTTRILDGIKKEAKEKNLTESSAIVDLLKDQINSVLQDTEKGSEEITSSFEPTLKDRPWVIMVVGVNGTGKTTSIGKLAKKYLDEGKRVLVAACDTFRAAAGEQLEIWAKRAGADLVKSQPGQDPASVAFDAIKSAMARKLDVVIADTAGRLHTKVNLMEELKKVKRVMDKCLPGAPQEMLLVIDATTGQNAISQTKLFDDALGLTGIILTKLDGTAKGGIVIAISQELKIPVRYIGVGEKVDDLELFDSKSFVEALFE